MHSKAPRISVHARLGSCPRADAHVAETTKTIMEDPSCAVLESAVTAPLPSVGEFIEDLAALIINHPFGVAPEASKMVEDMLVLVFELPELSGMPQSNQKEGTGPERLDLAQLQSALPTQLNEEAPFNIPGDMGQHDGVSLDPVLFGLSTGFMASTEAEYSVLTRLPTTDNISLDAPVLAALRISMEAIVVPKTPAPSSSTAGVIKTFSHRKKQASPMSSPAPAAVVADDSTMLLAPEALPQAVSQSDVAEARLEEAAVGAILPSPGRSGPQTASPKTVFLAKVSKPLGITLPPPVATRQKKTLPVDFRLRRSCRIAKLSPEPNNMPAIAVCR